MSLQKFDDNCPGCRPAIIDADTGRVLPDDDPMMVQMLKVWAGTSFQEREAYHRVMCLNSRDSVDLFLVNRIISKFKGSSPSTSATNLN